MSCHVKICGTVLQRLTYADKPCVGRIYGIYDNTNVTIIGLERKIATDKNLNIFASLPVPIESCGTFTVDNNDASNKFELGKFHVFCNFTTKEIVVESKLENKLNEPPYEIISDAEVFARYLMVQVKGAVPLRCEASKSSIQESFQKLKNQILSENVAFRISQLSIYVLHSKVICDAERENMTIKQLYESLNDNVHDEPNRKKKGKSVTPTILDADLLQKLSVGEADISLNHSPVCVLNKSNKKIINTYCKINSLAMIPFDAQLSDIFKILQIAILKYIVHYEEKFWPCFMENTSLEIDGYHFYPPESGHFLTLLYPAVKSDQDLVTERLSLHQLLMMNENFPMFRRANQFISNNIEVDGPLLNPHVGVRTVDNGGNQCLVRGNYKYYHYCQNGMDDSGWGCAYRSLQTLASWLKLQGYVDREVPTFHEIQKCLVDIKDKPSTFLGGGVLAHTILGVDYNPETGSIYFLILDPHYTGSEDLHTIQSKGWCGWKPVSFWQKDSYYNLCLPQVPRGV
ncbi:unnamed protein product [Callosobruchus maculatus]|uniref:Ufm1-specific protease 2 n=1 Tax=Callosobruchus maculatus TaxID=64391 RepID=A0A653DD02_CALMS|nr:unnamed protein product [Callosobruchus maculatus]